MTRRRWIYINGVAHEVSTDFVPENRVNTDAVLWNDRAYQDMNDPRFSSRAQHRQYMADHGLTTADDFKETWKHAEQHRNKLLQGVDPSRKQDMIQAFERLRDGRS